MIENIRIALAKLLFIGILISFAFILGGGFVYLFQNGNNPWQPSLINISTHPSFLSAQGIIQLGLWLLFFMQILRVAFTTWFFLKIKDHLFTAICGLVLIILLLTLVF